MRSLVGSTFEANHSLAVIAIAGRELGVRSWGSQPKYDMHVTCAKSLVRNISKQKIIDTFMQGYTPRNLLPILAQEINDIFKSNSTITTERKKEGKVIKESHRVMDHKWPEILEKSFGSEFHLDNQAPNNSNYQIISYLDDYDIEYQSAVGLSNEGVIRLLEHLGYITLNS